jgi:spermidine synthase
VTALSHALGQSIAADLFECDSSILNDVTTIEALMVAAARAANATVISVSFHHFSPFGVSGVVVIQESHLAIHTWPEFAFASVDIFTCGTHMLPQYIVEHLSQSLGAKLSQVSLSPRGTFARDHSPSTTKIADKISTPVPQYARDVWLTERQRDVAISLRHHGTPLFRAQSTVQKIEVYDTVAFGRALLLDQTIVCTEGDERAYHELIVHPAVCTLLSNDRTRPLRALVLGGGDGAVARELTAHPAVTAITVVELDPLVVQAVQRTLPSLARGLADRRVELVYQDALAFVQSQFQRSNHWDLIIVDAIDSPAPQAEFYAALKALCTLDTVLIVPGGLLRADPGRVRETHRALRSVFGEAQVHPFCVHIPTMATGTWIGFWVADQHPTHSIDRQLIGDFRDRAKLACYTAEAHVAAFALAPWIRALLY